jgi:hypothetical protein
MRVQVVSDVTTGADIGILFPIAVTYTKCSRIKGIRPKGVGWMIRAYKFLMRPTIRQEQALEEMLWDHCSLYNGHFTGSPRWWRPTVTAVARRPGRTPVDQQRTSLIAFGAG